MTSPSAQTWALFAADGNEQRLVEIARRQADVGAVSQYRIETVNPVAGQIPSGLASGWSMIRIESDATIRLEADAASLVVAFYGATQSLNYTNEPQRRELDAHSRSEVEPSEETVAVMIPIRKSPQWWGLAQDQRQTYFQTRGQYQGHTAIGLRYVDRVYRKLYHSRYFNPPNPYDFLTYFEFNRAHTEDFKSLLAELRDPTRNPEWTHIDLEYEIWMTKFS
jgi:hypothetical protein